MSAYSWAVVGGADSILIIGADEYRDEMVIQLHTMAVEGADPVFLGFGEDAVTQEGLFLGGYGHTVRVLGAKARLAVYALSAATSSGGIETHTSVEYRHTPNYPLWQKTPEQGQGPTLIHTSPLQDGENVPVNWETFIMMFDMNVLAGTGNILFYKWNPTSPDDLISTIDITDGAEVTIDGAVVSFTIPAVDLPGDLENNTRYYFLIGAGVITNEDATSWAGLALDTDWAFQTVT